MTRRRRKNSTALFEVFHTTNGNGHSHGSIGKPPTPGFGLRLPGWLLGRRRGAKSSASAVAPIEIDHNDPTSRADSIFGRSLDYAGPMAERLAVLAPPTTSRADTIAEDDSAPGRETRFIQFRMTYAGAAVAAVVAFALIATAFVVGRRMSPAPRPMLADLTTDEVRRGPARPEVTDLRDVETATPANIASDKTPPTQIAPPIPTNPPPKPEAAKPPTFNAPQPPSTFVEDNEHRTVGLNYVIIQCYPEEADANDAKAKLAESGIFSTVEPAPSAWVGPNTKMFAVIGIKGFNKIRNSAQYDQYVASIMSVSEKFAGKKRFLRFDPKPYKWRDAK